VVVLAFKPQVSYTLLFYSFVGIRSCLKYVNILFIKVTFVVTLQTYGVSLKL